MTKGFHGRLTRRRKGVSEVLGTIVLIAITLIAAVAVSGFVFGLFGRYTVSATVVASGASCRDNGAGVITCTMLLVNTGSANTNVVPGAVLNYVDSSLGAQTISGVASFANPLNSGHSGMVTVTFTENPGYGGAKVGSTFTGSVSLSNGGEPLFAGSF